MPARTFIPTNRVKSNMEQIYQAMNVFTPPVKNWSVQRRNTKLVASSVRESRAKSELAMQSLLLKSDISSHGEKKFLVVKRIGKIFSPIGFRNQFKTIESLKEFARQEGRGIVRVICGAVKKNYPVEA